MIEGPTNETGGMIALTREPSGKRASTIGVLSSQRLPKGEIIRSMTVKTAPLSLNLTSLKLILP